MAISLQQLTIYLYSAHRAVIFAIAQLSCLLFCSVFHHCRSTFEVCVWVFVCITLHVCKLLHVHECTDRLIVLTCNKYQIRPRKILQN